MSSSNSGNERRCATCHKSEREVVTSLKLCAKCKKQRYCSRECQRADWRQHRRECSDGLCSIPDPFAAISDGTWFLNRPEKDVYKLLIDIYRMKVEDKYVFEGDFDEDSLYAGASTSRVLKHFRQFLNNITKIDARRVPKLLPEWWSQDKITKCLNLAREDGWSFIGSPIEKHDVQEQYKQKLMPMQLRMMKEKLEGTLTAGQSCEEMLAALAGVNLQCM